MRIYLAATHSGMSKEDRVKFIEVGKPKYQLCSFFEGERNCLLSLQESGRENFLLDSGAFSFMVGAKCDKETLYDYCDRYISFINKYDVKYFFEMDVDTIFGIEFVEMLREKIERETDKKPIPVWHKSRGIDYWKKMVEDYDYIAIGGLVTHVKKQEWEYIKKLVDYAYFKGVKVHGLGFTKTQILEDWHFYSVDSASWTKSGALGQQVMTFDGKSIKTRRADTGDKKAALSKIVLYNGLEWCKYQRYMDSKRF